MFSWHENTAKSCVSCRSRHSLVLCACPHTARPCLARAGARTLGLCALARTARTLPAPHAPMRHQRGSAAARETRRDCAPRDRREPKAAAAASQRHSRRVTAAVAASRRHSRRVTAAVAASRRHSRRVTAAVAASRRHSRRVTAAVPPSRRHSHAMMTCDHGLGSGGASPKGKVCEERAGVAWPGGRRRSCCQW
jgi:hypothetical protein